MNVLYIKVNINTRLLEKYYKKYKVIWKNTENTENFINGKIKLPFLENKRHIIKTYDTMLVSNQTLKEGNNYVSTK